MNVSALLLGKSPDVVTVLVDAQVLDATRLLREKGIGSVVVTDDDGAVKGIVSERDIVRAIAVDGGDVLEVPVSQIMTVDVITCCRADKISQISETMTDGRFRHMPVVEDGQLVGIVSIGDVVKNRIAEAELEASSMKAYIAAG